MLFKFLATLDILKNTAAVQGDKRGTGHFHLVFGVVSVPPGYDSKSRESDRRAKLFGPAGPAIPQNI
jgi:hypothetical protein